MEETLARASQGLLSTAITVDQLWDKHAMSWIEVRRLELEVGPGGDHDQPFTWSSSLSGPQLHTWAKLLGRRRERGEFVP